MENQTELEWKIGYHHEEKKWIIYRVLTKSEAEAHLANFDQQIEIFNQQKSLWEQVRDEVKPA